MKESLQPRLQHRRQCEVYQREPWKQEDAGQIGRGRRRLEPRREEKDCANCRGRRTAKRVVKGEIREKQASSCGTMAMASTR